MDAKQKQTQPKLPDVLPLNDDELAEVAGAMLHDTAMAVL